MSPYYQKSGITLYHGDCLEVLPTLPDGSVDAVVTDPPYGVDYQSAWRTDSQRFAKIANDKRPFVWWIYGATKAIKDGGAMLCFCRWDMAEAFRLAMEWSGLKIGAQLVWDRGNHGLGDPSSRPAPRHDIIWFAVKGRFQFHGRRPSSVYTFMRINGLQLEHPNQKPIDLMASLVADYCPPGGTVLDPFAGSGTTGIACQREGRNCILVEQELTYCEIAAKRLEAEIPALFKEATA